MRNFYKLRSFAFIFASSLSFSSELPSDALQFLEKIPGKSISPDFVLHRAIKSSSSFRSILLQLPLASLPQKEVEAAYDTLLNSQVSYIHSDAATANPLFPVIEKSLNAEASLSKKLKSGTAFTAKYEWGNPRFSSGGISNYHEHSWSLEAAQDLWKNSFGKLSQSEFDFAQRSEKAAQWQVAAAAEQWVLGIVALFYEAWTMQKSVKSAKGDWKRKKTLAWITRKKFNRGTAEEPEKLQIESSALASEGIYITKKQGLISIWQNLVISLQLPREWMQIDPEIIPMSIPENLEKSFCEAKKAPIESALLKAKEYENKKLKDSLSLARSEAKPELSAFAQLAANGIDSQYFDSLVDSFSFQNPSLLIGLRLQMPLGFLGNKTKIMAATIQEKISETATLLEREQLEVKKENTCSEFSAIDQNVQLLEKALKKQKRRNYLETKRFQNGTTSMLNVIQSSDDAARVELSLSQIQAQQQLAFWQLKSLKGEILTKIKTELSAMGVDL